MSLARRYQLVNFTCHLVIDTPCITVPIVENNRAVQGLMVTKSHWLYVTVYITVKRYIFAAS